MIEIRSEQKGLRILFIKIRFKMAMVDLQRNLIHSFSINDKLFLV